LVSAQRQAPFGQPQEQFPQSQAPQQAAAGTFVVGVVFFVFDMIISPYFRKHFLLSREQTESPAKPYSPISPC